MAATIPLESALKHHPPCQAILQRMPEAYALESKSSFCESIRLQYIPRSVYFPCRC